MRDAEKIVDALLENDQVDPKDYLDDRGIRNTPITISGSYGSFTVDRETGQILSREVYDPNDDAYSDILRFDVAEFQEWLAKNAPQYQLEDDDALDIVNVGFWVEGEEPGTEGYVAAEEEHRGITYLGHDP